MIDLKDEQLGANYKKDATTFRVYAPTREKIDLLWFNETQTGRKNKTPMKKNKNGVFEVTIEGDLDGFFYNYLVEEIWQVTDPYAKSSSINSKSAAIIDLESTDPEGFREHKSNVYSEDEAVIYELNVKDFTSSLNSGVKHRGKYLGLSEKGTQYESLKTGLSHLSELGVTHIQLLPIYDFCTVDEDDAKFFDDGNYNWGYDPELYFTPEGSYSLNPEDPKSRVIELKGMIQAVHEAGMNVIMDVVFNHTFKLEDSNFEILYPKYYHRCNQNGDFSNGSGVGNEFKSESVMGRKLIIECLEYWVREYKIDGFRFDLMALIDIDTILDAKKRLQEINPNIIFYGEPWMALDSPLDIYKQILPGSQKNKGFAIFNGYFREAIKGDNDGCSKGYIQGAYNLKHEVETGIAGSIHYDDKRYGFCEDASETINYFNCHDNLILYDKLKISLKEDHHIKDMTKLAFSLILLALGKPFFYEGNEFMHSKKNVSNSYNAPLSINEIDWNKKRENFDLFNYIKELIALRRSHDVFKMTKKEEIKERLKFIDFLEIDTIGYTIKLEDKRHLLIIINASKSEKKIPRENLLQHLGYKDIKLKKIFSKNGREDFEITSKDIWIDLLSANIYMIGENYGL